MKRIILLSIAFSITISGFSKGRLRDWGICPGIFQPGEYNAITDVPGVKVGHVTKIEGDDIRTGVTAIIPHEGNLYQKKCPAAIFVANGFGKMAGYTQVAELGTIETPIVMTNTLSVAPAIEGIVTYTLNQKGNEKVKSVNSVVCEVNDGVVNNIRARKITEKDVLKAIAKAESGPVKEGNVGAGTGSMCFSWKGGIGTSSRVLPQELGGYTVGVLVQTNYSGICEIAGFPAGKELGKYSFSQYTGSAKDSVLENHDGSCWMVLITDAPLDSRMLGRVAKRMFMGLGKTGSFAANGSGDYCMAISVYPDNLVNENTSNYYPVLLHDKAISPIFAAAVEATQEALLNALFAAEEMKGYQGHKFEAFPVEQVMEKMGKKLIEK